MGSREVIELSNAYIEIEARPGYLFVIESGQISRRSELKRYTSRLDAIAKRLERNKALIDARGEVGDPPAEVRDAMWQWLTAEDRAFDFIAFVLPTELAVARVNMTALARKARLRAFDSVQVAQRWLLRDPRISTAGTMPKLESQPPAIEVEVEEAGVEGEVDPREPSESGRRPALRPGQYRVSEAPVDRISRTPRLKKKPGGRVA